MTSGESIDALFDGWSAAEVANSGSSGGVSFGIDEDVDAPLFRVELPADPTAAAQLLREKDQALSDQQRALDLAERQLQALLSGELRLPGRGGPVVSFGVEDGGSDDGACAQVQQILARLNQLIGGLARVETRCAGELCGATQIGWSGDFLTVWAPQTTPEKRELHFHGVRQALRSRMSIVRLVSLVMTGATTLAVKWCLPGGALRVLPAAWSFLRDVIQEVQSLRKGATR